MGTILDRGAGVKVSNGSGHRVDCNHLGLNAAGTGDLGAGSLEWGVLIQPGSGGDTVSGAIVGTNGDGVDDVGERNVFGSAPTAAILVGTALDSVIAGNYFGVFVRNLAWARASGW